MLSMRKSIACLSLYAARSTDAIVVADTPRDEDEELCHPAEGKNARQALSRN
jgi:hypothetical protein